MNEENAPPPPPPSPRNLKKNHVSGLGSRFQEKQQVCIGAAYFISLNDIFFFYIHS